MQKEVQYICRRENINVPITDIGSTHQLEVTEFYPSTAINKSVGRWESSDESVVSVDSNGLVKINGSGVATIKVYSTDEQCYATCKFFVQRPALTEVKASANKNSIDISWNEEPKADGYYVYSYNRNTGEYNRVAELKTNNPKYTASRLEAVTEYIYKVVSFTKNYCNGDIYESVETVVKESTFDYVPVNSYFGLPNPIDCLVEGGAESNVFWFSYSPYENVYDKLVINCKAEDESIAKVASLTKADDSPNKYNYTIKPISAGITKLVISSNDKKGVTYEIPVGILTKAVESYDFSSINGVAEYQKLTLTFDGLEDESKIDGYMVRRTQTMMFRDLEYIPKQGNGTKYTYIQTKDIKDGDSYRYTVVPVLIDGTNYFRMYYTKWINVTFPTAILVENIDLDKDVYNVPLDSTMGISAKITPDDASYGDLIFTMMNSKLAYVQQKETVNGTNYAILNPKKAGTTTIEVAAADNSNVKKYAKVVVTPKKINSINIAPMSNAIRIVWEGLDEADGYFIYRYNDTTDKWDTVGDVRTTEFIDTGLENNTNYRYKAVGYIVSDNEKYAGSISEDINATTFLGSFDISVSGYEGIYDGNEHNAVIFGADVADNKIMYSTDGKNWIQDMPVVKYVKDTKTIYIKEIKSDESEYITSVNANVKKAAVTPNMPLASLTVDNRINNVDMIILDANWEWQKGENAFTLEAGKTTVATVVYIGEDKGNYEIETIDIAITRAACKLSNTTLKNEIAATCTMPGYTGDYVCNECGEVVKAGSKIEAFGHKWNNGEIIKEATKTEEGLRLYVCTICNEAKYETIPMLEDESTTLEESSSEETTPDETTSGETTKNNNSNGSSIGGNNNNGNINSDNTNNSDTNKGNTINHNKDSKNGKADKSERVKTGDNGIIVIAGVILLSSISGIIYSISRKRKINS